MNYVIRLGNLCDGFYFCYDKDGGKWDQFGCVYILAVYVIIKHFKTIRVCLYMHSFSTWEQGKQYDSKICGRKFNEVTM